MVQRYVFDAIEDPRLHAYVVWGPMLDNEERSDAVEATRFFDDERSTHFWTDDDVLAASFSEPVGLPAGELAWDTFLLFAPGRTWADEPPEPAYAMHVGRSLPEERRLHGPTLHDQVIERLAGEVGGDGEAATAAASATPGS